MTALKTCTALLLASALTTGCEYPQYNDEPDVCPLLGIMPPAPLAPPPTTDLTVAKFSDCDEIVDLYYRRMSVKAFEEARYEDAVGDYTCGDVANSSVSATTSYAYLPGPETFIVHDRMIVVARNEWNGEVVDGKILGVRCEEIFKPNFDDIDHAITTVTEIDFQNASTKSIALFGNSHRSYASDDSVYLMTDGPDWFYWDSRERTWEARQKTVNKRISIDPATGDLDYDIAIESQGALPPYVY